MRKMFSGILFLLLLFSILTLAVKIKPVKSTWTGTVYIMADGSIYPTGAPVTTYDNITYTLTCNIISNASGIIAERDNIIIDGAGYTLQGTGTLQSKGVDLTERGNVTIKNMEIEAFYYGISLSFSNHSNIYGNNITNNEFGIWLYNSSNNTVYGNNITANSIDGVWLYKSQNNKVYGNNLANNEFGIWLYDSSSNTVFGNNIANKEIGVRIYYSSNNTVYGNNITANSIDGVRIYYSSNNTVYGNNIVNCGNGVYLYNSPNNKVHENNVANNEYGFWLCYSSSNIVFVNNIENNEIGIWLHESPNNKVYGNNFINNVNQTFSRSSANVWDNNYPSGGNYWSDYYGTDLFKGPNQDQHGSDGIGDSPYVIDSQNRDNYPLMYPYGSLPPPYHNLTITTTIGGTTEPPPETYTYANDTIVSVTAKSDVGYSFDCWLLDGVKRTENPISIIMHSNHTLEAYFIDNIPPEISEPWQDPLPNNVQTFQNVTVWVNVTDYGTGIKNVTLWYSLNNGTTWEEPIDMKADTTITYKAVIPGYENCTRVTYKIIAYDNAGNSATKNNNGYYYQYHVIPESPSIIILIISLISTLTATTIWKVHCKAG